MWWTFAYAGLAVAVTVGCLDRFRSRHPGPAVLAGMLWPVLLLGVAELLMIVVVCWAFRAERGVR